MGLRFRKGVKLFPGIRLNVTKHGLSSFTIGGRGLTYNIGKKGTRGTVGLPGSGLSYSEYSSYKKPAKATQIDPETGEILAPTKEKSVPWLLVILIAGIVLGVYLWRTPA